MCMKIRLATIVCILFVQWTFGKPYKSRLSVVFLLNRVGQAEHHFVSPNTLLMIQAGL